VKKLSYRLAQRVTHCATITPACSLAAGESVVAVAERLGYENAALVLKTYGHLCRILKTRSRRAIDDAWTSEGTQTESDHR
jgi:hypothetical protein